MSRKLRQLSSLKLSLRLTLAAAAIALSGLIAMLLIVFNLTKEEMSHAETNMVFKTAETSQIKTNVLRGSINQLALGVMIETTGSGNTLKLNNIEFNAHGTTLPVASQIENARLWYTGNSGDFIPSQQVYSTILKITEKNFEFNCNQSLLSGKNYFWLTFDIKPDASISMGAVDAECIDMNIGAVTYQPEINAPEGKRTIDSNIPFYSNGNNVVNNINAWNSKRDGTGVPPKQLYAPHHTYFVQAGHHMINASATNLYALVVEKGGELRITAPLRMSSMNIACGGMVQMDAIITDFYCFDEFNMDNGANYLHNSAGFMPAQYCNFSRSSNQTFYQYGKTTFQDNIQWGNLTVDATSPVNIDLENCINNIQGNFEVKKTAKDNYIYIGAADTINIGGNLAITGGRFMGIAGPGKGMLVINLQHDLIVRSGAIHDAGFISNETAGTILNIKGDVALLSGTFDFNRSKRGNSSINIGSLDKTCHWMQKTACEITLGNTNVSQSCELELMGDKFGEIAAGRKLTVSRFGRLMCGKNQVTGDGGFELEDFATLGIGHADGICSEDAVGNIITHDRLFHSGAYYYYYLGESPQQTGMFVTQPLPNTVRAIIVQKDKNSQTVSLSHEIAVIENVKINKGDLDQRRGKLILPKTSETP